MPTQLTVGADGRWMPRVGSIPPSCVHEVFRAVERWADGRAVIRLHVGEPAFRPPRAVHEAVTDALRRGRTTYGPAEGIPELREALAAKLLRRNGHDARADLVFVTLGSSQGLAALFQTVADPGDEVLLPALHWPVHLQQVLLAGLRPVFYPLDDHFRPDLRALADLGGSRARALLVNSPANPSGAVCRPEHLRPLLDLARRRSWQVISDEAYEDFVFEGEHVSLASLERDVPWDERIVSTAFSFSKSYAMTGHRLGYVVVANHRLASAFGLVQEATIVCPQMPVQYGALAALKSDTAVEANREHLRRAAGLLAPLTEAGLLAYLPEGGWYALLEVPAVGLDATAYAQALLEAQGVALAPADGFAIRPEFDEYGRILGVPTDLAASRFLRVALCGDHTALRRGVERIVEFAAKG
ncbi:pyridoxal phosphate-dependent aminotransferase [Salinispora arenicola]|uniref:pyridoxal phosphate-dependent aminotransferase n=1 Tax=Salinispora arenicola TaxID=168697 RepID=UPI00036855E2|nr:pyridoxal phosphate-dependent aminotransferase [Salinispora arenicola]